jgi:hypothetical protein
VGQQAGELFVGRRRQVDEVIALLQTPGPAIGGGTTIFALGLPGIGKTYLLNHLEARAGELGPHVFVFPRHELVPDHPVRDATDQVTTAWNTLQRSIETRILFLDLVAKDDPTDLEHFDEFRGAAQIVHGGRSTPRAPDVDLPGNTLVSRRLSMRDSSVVTNITYEAGSSELTQQDVARLQADVDAKFLEGWTVWAAHRHVLLAIDDFELLAGTHFAEWLLDQVPRLPQLVVVAACAASAVPKLRRPRSQDLHHWHLGPLTLEEVEGYFAARFAPIVVAEGVPEVAYRYTDGHPGGVDLVADLVGERGADTLSAVDLRLTLDRLPPDPDGKWAALVAQILASVSDTPLMTAAEACSVVDRFDPQLLGDLVGWPREQVKRTIEQLDGIGLTHRLRFGPAGRAPGWHRMCGFVRRALAESLAAQSDELGRYHRLAARHFAGRLEAIEDGESGEYTSWYRYERADWQRYKSEWLHHTSQVPGAGFLTRARFTIVFLEAFFWWGCYEPFGFNHQLLLDWLHTDLRYSASADESPEEKDEEHKDAQLGANLGFLLEHYPPGHRKESDRWPEILQRLRRIRRLCGLHEFAKVEPDERRDLDRVEALLRVFMAHACHHGPPQLHRAAAGHFDRSLELCAELDDGWMTAWLLFEKAEHLVEQGEGAEGLELVRRSARALADITAAEHDGPTGDGAELDWDEELVANLWRLHGDLLRARSPALAGEAFASYGRALLNAYRFLGRRPPDPYTTRYYWEITSRIAERLVEAAAAGDEAADRARALYDVLALEDDVFDEPFDGAAVAAALADGDAVALAAALFPRGPEPDELHEHESEVVDRWNTFMDDAPPTGADVDLLLSLPDLPGLPGLPGGSGREGEAGGEPG